MSVSRLSLHCCSLILLNIVEASSAKDGKFKCEDLAMETRLVSGAVKARLNRPEDGTPSQGHQP